MTAATIPENRLRGRGYGKNKQTNKQQAILTETHPSAKWGEQVSFSL